MAEKNEKLEAMIREKIAAGLRPEIAKEAAENQIAWDKQLAEEEAAEEKRREAAAAESKRKEKPAPKAKEEDAKQK